MPKNAHILVSLVEPSDLPPGADAEFTLQAEPTTVQAVIRCSTPRAAADCFLHMLGAMRLSFA